MPYPSAETLPDRPGSQDSRLLPSTTHCTNSCLILPNLKVTSHQSLPVPPVLPGESGPCHALPSWGAQGPASMRDLRLATSPLLLPLPDQRGLQTTAQRVEQNSLPAAPGRPLWVCPPTSTTRRLSREITESGFKSCPSEGQTALMNFSSHQPPSQLHRPAPSPAGGGEGAPAPTHVRPVPGTVWMERGPGTH